MSDRTASYAEGIVAIARAEGHLDAVTDELRQLASALEGNERLRDALTDPTAPVGRRLALLETEVLGSASTGTRAAVAALLAAGRADDIGDVSTEVARVIASEHDRELAEVRVAKPIDEQRREALRQALEQATGKQLELQVVVDESVVGGVRAIVGDRVLDGSVARRLDQIRTKVGS
jgi:F-type H+-transporting ATPase subunit delta